MTPSELLETLLKACLLLLSTISLRDIWQRVSAATGIKAWGETHAEIGEGVTWVLATAISCPVCSTYWLGMLAAVCLWPLPVLGFWYQAPAWLLGGLSAAWLVNHFNYEAKPAETTQTAGPVPVTDIDFELERDRLQQELEAGYDDEEQQGGEEDPANLFVRADPDPLRQYRETGRTSCSLNNTDPPG